MVINSLIFLREFSNKIQKQQIDKVRSRAANRRAVRLPYSIWSGIAE